MLDLRDPRIHAAADPIFLAERDQAVAVTGHRPDKIGGYNPHNPQRKWIRSQLRARLVEFAPAYTISGMALGVDQDWAEISVELGIPFVAAIPCLGQESRWLQPSRDAYYALLDQAQRIVIVSVGAYAAWMMQVRNKWMVDRCHTLVAVWDPNSGGTGSGTGNCVAYAQRARCVMSYIDPRDWRA